MDDEITDKMGKYFKKMFEYEATDLYLTTGAPPFYRVEGELKAVDENKIKPGHTHELANELLDDEKWKEFNRVSDINLARSIHKLGRYRINIFRQRNELAIVVRLIRSEVPKPHELGLPTIMTEKSMEKSGLFIVCGATDSGKSTTVASMLEYRGLNKTEHIITIEDPIEFLHRHSRSIINQREVGIDTPSFEEALRNSLRQTPDAVLIGETRSKETMQQALTFADTGHFCITTLHANNTTQALERILSFFPKTERDHILHDLSLNLRCLVTQRLVPTITGKRVAAIEIMTDSPLVREEIKRGNLTAITTILEKSVNLGMQTFDHALFKLANQGIISKETALNNADSINNLRIRFSLSEGKNPDDVIEKMTLAEPENDDEDKGRIF